MPALFLPLLDIVFRQPVPRRRYLASRAAGADSYFAVWVVGSERPASQFEQSLALAYCDRTKPIRRALMKILGVPAIVVIVLYFADQQFAQGRYTDAVQQMGTQMMHSLGIF